MARKKSKPEPVFGEVVKKTFDTQQEWYDFRKEYIGASEISTLMGTNPYQTPYELFMSKVNPDPWEENVYTKAGHLLENAVANYFEDEVGHRVIKASADDIIYSLENKPHIACTPDRRLFLEGGGKGILECKTTQKYFTHEDYPEYWKDQVIYQMGIMGIHKGYIAWLVRGLNFYWIEVEYDQARFNEMIHAVDNFWFGHIKPNRMPEPITSADVMAQNPNHISDKFNTADQDMLEKYNRLIEVGEKMDDLKEEAEAIKEAMKIACGESEGLANGDNILCTWKTANGRKVIDAKALQKDHPDIYEKYLVEGKSYRRFSLMK